MQQYRKDLGKVSLTSEGAWDSKNYYKVLSIVYDEHTEHGFISKKDVPVGVDLYNKEYWMPLNVSGYADNNIIILSKKTSDNSIKSYTLEEAIKSIASVGRRPGAILGFYNDNNDRLDIGGRWELWQFNDVNIYNWENVASWQNIYHNYNKFVGWYKSEEALKKYNPFPEIGCYAFVGTELNEATVYLCETKYSWINTTQHSWDYVKVVIDGNVSVGENGNWFNDGEDTGIPASIKGENGKTPVIRNNNNILEYSYDNVVWKPISDEIAAYFRWQSIGGQQANSTGKIQISRDKVIWTDLSGEFVNSLRISRYIGADESLPTSGIAEGTIYAKGPTYAEDDDNHDYPKYRLWVYAWKDNTLAWQDNGEFTSIAAGIVQELGNNENAVPSQKLVTENINRLDDISNEALIKAYDNFKSINKLEYNDILKSHYYNASGVLISEDYNAYSVAYYNVSEGDKYIIEGYVNGNYVSAIALLGTKGENAIKVYDISISNSNPSTVVDRYIKIDSGINYIALSVSQSDEYRLKVYKIVDNSRLDENISATEKNAVDIVGLKTASIYIAPKTEKRNLISDDYLYFNEDKAKKGIFELSNETYKHVMSRLIEVKPSTEYTIGYVSQFYEWDNNLNIIKTTSVNPSGYDIHTFTTLENTKYVSIKRWIDNKGIDSNTKFLVEGTTSEIFQPEVLEVNYYNGSKAGFVPGKQTLSLIETNSAEIYREELPLEYSEIQKDTYISGDLSFISMSGWSVWYIPVTQGTKYLIRGRASGNNVAGVCIVENIGVIGEKGEALLIAKTIGTSVKIDTTITIEEGINYIAISSASIGTVTVYQVTSNSRLDRIKDVEDKFNTYADTEELSVDERVNNHYYSPWGGYNEDSYGGFHVEYYPIEAGQKIHLKGSFNGNISAFALVEEKGVRSNLYYGFGVHGETRTIDEIITVPKGYNWLARSFSSSSTTKAFFVKSVNHFELLDSEVENLKESVKELELFSNLKGKRLLAIGDSITAQNLWQKKAGELLGMNVRTHAKGGIGIIQMVDGDGSGDAPSGYDPDNFGTSTIYKLNAEDVKDVDIIILMGFYNTRGTAESNRGELTDMYPSQNTWYGQMNYAIKRVYEELENAGNTNCKVVICSAHNYGKYPYSNKSAYDDGQILLDATKAIANRHSLFLIDLMNNGNINMYNWGKFQSSSTSYATNYIPSDGVNDGTNKPFSSLDVAPSAASNNDKYITILGVSGCYKSNGTSWEKLSSPAYPWNGDQLHLNQAGGYRLGEYIAGQLLTI